MMRELFLGRPVFWALWVVIIAVLTGLGLDHSHVRWFPTFILLLLALSAGSVGFVVFAYRKGEAITREPFEGAAAAVSPRAVADE